MLESPFWTGHEDAASFRREQQERIARAQETIRSLQGAAGPSTADGALRLYDEAVFDLDSAGSRSSLLANVHPEADFRAAAEAAGQEVAAAAAALSLNRDVYDRLASFAVSDADAETRHYLGKTLRDFRLAGVDKDEATRQRIAALREELVALGQEFERGIREDRRSVAVDAAELRGLPADYVLRHAPDANGRVTITTDYPDALPVFAYAHSETLRRALYMEYTNRAYPRNMEVLGRMLERRHLLAGLVGFRNWADLITADKMVGSADRASQFIDSVVAASGARAAREYERLLARKRASVAGALDVEAWEAAYWLEQMRRTECDFDAQSVRPYFPFVRVKQGLLDVCRRLFGVTFTRREDAPVWHPTVECWEMHEDGELKGRFYLDLFPRPGKYTHAAHFDIRAGVGGRHLPEAALVCNFPRPTADDPGLLEPSDVRTFFHEFGHLLHGLFAGERRWAGVAGIRTEHDFVEAPSQAFEEWTQDAKVLATFAHHHETGEPIPADLVARMKRANELGKALAVRRQMVLARTSLSYHDRPAGEVDTDALHERWSAEYLPYTPVRGTHFQCAFGHLDGYSAVYYTYMWSLVIAKDLFAQFDHEDLMAPDVARRYREAVLAPGGSAPAAELVRRFLGRDFTTSAWERWLQE